MNLPCNTYSHPLESSTPVMVTRCSWIFTDAVDRFWKIPDAISSRRRQVFHHWKPIWEREREKEFTKHGSVVQISSTQLFARWYVRNVKWSNEKQRRYVELTIERDAKLQQSNRSRNLLWFCVKTRSIASGSSGSMKNSQAFGSRWKGSSVGGVEREWIKRNYGILLHARVKLTRACGKYVHIGNRTNVVSSRLLRVRRRRRRGVLSNLEFRSNSVALKIELRVRKKKKEKEIVLIDN